MPAVKMGADCRCHRKCLQRVGEEKRNQVFSRYWALNSNETKNAYLNGLIQPRPIIRRRQKDVSKQSKAQYYYKIQLQLDEWDVCRKAFANIHGISIYHVEKIIEAKTTGTPITDNRGRGPSANKYSQDQVDRVHQQIQSLIVTASHYTRAHSPNRRYLDDPGNNYCFY